MEPNVRSTAKPMARTVSQKRRLQGGGALCWLLSMALACTMAPLFPKAAQADEAADAAAEQQAVDHAQTTLGGAESRMQDLAAEYVSLEQDAAALQQRIDETAAQAMETQQAVIEGRVALGKTAKFEYRSGSAQSLVTLVLEAADFDELVRNLYYLSTVTQHQAQVIEEQKARSQRFDAIVEDLNAQKDEQDKKLSEIAAKKAEADQVVAEATTKLQGAQNDYTARLAALKQKADEMAARGAVTEPVVDEGANTVDRPAAPETPVQPNPDPTPPAPTPDPGGGSGGSDAGWSTGTASAYGGSTDPYTPNPGTTATGEVCDDNSMGVAVPMAWPHYWQYYGRTVEISYNGMTVFATVNDCGGMGGGSRVLDLQPGVWKAFGFSSCNDWGLRTVSYRFL
ncbi:MAG: hypothetical protein RRZ85_02705 [Gordonibacter sp.]|uniref:coiled-coil domain-containing protein n=1 Tax=Gordonibacter sp. TaxID=1968902 RepID=UPI002FC9DC5C